MGGRAGASPKARRSTRQGASLNYAIIDTLLRMQDLSHDDGLFLEALMATVTHSGTDAQDRLKDFLEKRATRVGPQRKA